MMMCQATIAATLDTYSARPVNLSLTGIGLSMAASLEPGAIVHLSLLNSPCLFSVQRTAEVRYIMPQAAGVSLVGCEFLEPLASNELRLLLI